MPDTNSHKPTTKYVLRDTMTGLYFKDCTVTGQCYEIAKYPDSAMSFTSRKDAETTNSLIGKLFPSLHFQTVQA